MIDPELLAAVPALADNDQLAALNTDLIDIIRGRRMGKASTKPAKEGKGTGRPNKYHAQPTEYNGRRYDSKAEANHAMYLDSLKAQGIILSWVPQVSFPLPGGAVHRVDFMLLFPPMPGGTVPLVAFQEKKGRDLPMGKLKRKQVEELYKIHIEVV